jgi:hypothetical protein
MITIKVFGNLKNGSMKEASVDVSDIKGYIYSSNGVFLEHIDGSENAFLAESYTKNGDGEYGYTIEPIDLGILHSDFTYIAYVVMKEGSADEKELKCIAYASYNHSKALGKSWKGLLSTGYSSVPLKKELPDKDSTNQAQMARRSVIYVLRRNDDITKGAELWDGTDFLAWGDSESNPYGSIGQSKFDQYKFVEIPNDVYNTYLSHNGASVSYKDNDKHSLDECEGTHTHISKKKERKKEDGTIEVIETNKKIKYEIPAQEFNDVKYRTCNGDFYYDKNSTGIKQTKGISATIAAGKSIFWKITKERLTSGSVGICDNKDCDVHHKK